MNNQPPNDFARQAQDFFTRSVSEQIRAAQRVYDLAVRFGRGALSPQAFYDEYLRFASQETGRYASDFATLGLNFYKDWFALGLQYSNHFYETIASRPGSAAGDVITKSTSGSRRFHMELHAPLGQEMQRSFVLEHKRGGAADISFVVSAFTGTTGTFQLPLQIQPDHFHLEPGQEMTVTLRLQVPAGLLAVNQHFQGTIYVQGYDNLELVLTVWVDAPDSTQVHDSVQVKTTRKKSVKRKVKDGKSTE